MQKKQISSRRSWDGALATTRNHLHFANHPRAIISKNRNLRFCKFSGGKRLLQEVEIHLLAHSPFPMITSKSPPVRSATSGGHLLDGGGISLTQSFMRLPMDFRIAISFRKVDLVRFIAVKSMGLESL